MSSNTRTIIVQDRYRINYEYVKRHQKVRIELIRETPMRLGWEDGRRADVTVQ
ncbi:hypothetical protein [Candidatus Amarolinea dominans]|uniref:hypothetical protein n=1 Tax=Candidatus Amarolinea dominans TaxID=3140696 RepID=UPI003136E2AD|nr:hypothetical protein [Anaerolineae bacterium]